MGPRAHSHRPSLSCSPSTPSTPSPSRPQDSFLGLAHLGPEGYPLDHSGQEPPQKRLCPEKFHTCIHLVGGTSNVRMAAASEWLAGPGPARSFFRSPALGLLAAPALPRGSLCCARRGRRTHQAVQIRSGSHLAAQSLCVCVCVCVCECACVCVRPRLLSLAFSHQRGPTHTVQFVYGHIDPFFWRPAHSRESSPG